jgi:hypothetical protein
MSALAHARLRSLLTVACAAAVTASGSVVSAQPVAKVKGNGAYISVGVSDTSGCITGYVHVSKSGTSASPTTWMSYDVYDTCAAQWLAYGSGQIPNTAFKTTGKSASLSVTPSAVPGFFMEGAMGAFRLTVTPTGAWTSSYSGHIRHQFVDRLIHSHGAWTYKQATATGTALGYQIGTTWGEMGEGRDKFMEIERGAK